VKNGENGILVFAPSSATSEATTSGAGRWDGRFPTTNARAAYVFDVSQTEGKPLPEPVQFAAEINERLKAVLSNRGITGHPSAHRRRRLRF